MSDILYLVAKVAKFESLECENLPPVMQFKAPDGVEGFCWVFNDVSKAVEYAGDVNLVTPIRYKAEPGALGLENEEEVER